MNVYVAYRSAVVGVSNKPSDGVMTEVNIIGVYKSFKDADVAINKASDLNEDNEDGIEYEYSVERSELK